MDLPLNIYPWLFLSMEADFRSGFVVITGKPNVGKSTLLNVLIGESLSITSNKPQTTRMTIKGIYNSDNSQIVFLDTPGFLKPRYELHNRMQKQITDTLKDADVVLFIADYSDFPTDYDIELLETVKKIKRPKIAIVNKSDLSSKNTEEDLRINLEKYFDSVLFISAQTGKNVDQVIPSITKFIPFNPPYFNKDDLSDLPMRFFAQEIVREGIFRIYKQEIPYSSAVVIDKYEETSDKNIIHATIWIERESQKPILIGSHGRGLQQIREYAEKKFTDFSGILTEFHIWVKVKPGWRSNPRSLKELGFKY